MIVKSYIIIDIYINVAVNSFEKEKEILDFSIVSIYQGEKSLPIWHLADVRLWTCSTLTFSDFWAGDQASEV